MPDEAELSAVLLVADARRGDITYQHDARLKSRSRSRHRCR
jgi:hypothetical protein